MRKQTVFLYILIFLTNAILLAQENRMWIPSEFGQYYHLLQEKNIQIPASLLYSPDKPALNDAIVQFNGGCTGSFISPDGLLITNHHCGYSAIQAHSTLEHNYVKDGFWAEDKSEELPNPGMYVTIVRKIIDVTDAVLQGVSDKLTEKERQSIIDKNINTLKKQMPKENWQDISIVPFFYGNKYYAFIEDNYKDVRLVGAPPSALGKFGADTDNWMWPRHSADFSLFRVYADKNNRPAEYSPDNVPYKPDKYLRVSMKGVKERELIMVYGFPGRTREYLPSFVIEQITKKINPVRIEIRDIALKIMDRYMHLNDTIKLKYTAQYARVANYWKKWKGENRGIDRSYAVENKKYNEKLFLDALKAKGAPEEDLHILDRLKQAYEERFVPENARNIFIEAAYVNNPWMYRGYKLVRLMNEMARQPGKAVEMMKKFRAGVDQIFENSDKRVDTDLFEAMMTYYKEHMPGKYADSILARADIKKLTRNIAEKSVVANPGVLKKALEQSPENFRKAMENDSGYVLAQTLINDLYGNINPDYYQSVNKTRRLMRKYQKLLFETYPNRNFVPDANGTLRLTFGRVEGYEPRDGVFYAPFTTIDGVIEKYIPGDYEFDLPGKFLSLYEKKDYGPYADGQKLIVNFLGTAHTTGGNSGSPALNEKGELVGLNFDRVWEGTMSDLYYDPAICRNIMVDMRYILFIIDKYGNAQNIIREINPKKQ